MMSTPDIDRRRFLLGALQTSGFFLLAGCDSLSRSDWFPSLLSSAEGLTRRVQRLLTPRRAVAKEYTEADLSPVFPANGRATPKVRPITPWPRMILPIGSWRSTGWSNGRPVFQ